MSDTSQSSCLPVFASLLNMKAKVIQESYRASNLGQGGLEVPTLYCLHVLLCMLCSSQPRYMRVGARSCVTECVTYMRDGALCRYFRAFLID